MASQYFIQREDQETGPFGFKELVAFVREGKLVHADRVRFSWTNQWQRADSLVGLFHMAKKAPEQLTPPAELLPPLAEEPILAEPDEPVLIPEIVDRPGWVMRLMQVSGFRSKNPTGIPILGPAPATPSEASPLAALQVGSDESASSRPAGRIPIEGQPAEIAAFFNQGSAAEGNRWSSAVEEAMAAAQARDAGKSARSHSSRFGRIFGGLAQLVPRGEQGQSLMRNGFRIGCAIVCANLAAYAVENWSAQEALRFPSRESQQTTLQHFPLLGTCGSGEYLFLMFDLMLLTGVAAWFAAGWLESHAE